MRIQQNLPSTEPKVEMLSQLSGKEIAILEPISLQKIIGFLTKMGLYVNWNESYTVLVGQIQNTSSLVWKEKRDCTTLITGTWTVL